MILTGLIAVVFLLSVILVKIDICYLTTNLNTEIED